MSLTAEQADVLKELINIGVGRAAGALSELTGAFVRLRVPFVSMFTVDEFKKEIDKDGVGTVSAVQLQFSGAFAGTASLMFPPDSAAKLVVALCGEEESSAEPVLDSVRVGTLNEIGNIVINGVMGSIGNILGEHVEYSVPNYVEDSVDGLMETNSSKVDDESILLARTRFSIEQFQVQGDVILMFEVGSFDALLNAIDNIRITASL